MSSAGPSRDFQCIRPLCTLLICITANTSNPPPGEGDALATMPLD